MIIKYNIKDKIETVTTPIVNFDKDKIIFVNDGHMCGIDYEDIIYISDEFIEVNTENSDKIKKLFDHHAEIMQACKRDIDMLNMLNAINATQYKVR